MCARVLLTLPLLLPSPSPSPLLKPALLTPPLPPPRLHSGHLPTIDLKVVGIRSGSQSLLIDDGDGNGDVQKNKTVKASSTRIWIILKPDNFFSVLAFRPPIHKLRFPEPPPSTTKKNNNKVNNKKRYINWFSKMVTKASFFENAYRFRVKGLKRRFSNTMIKNVIVFPSF